MLMRYWGRKPIKLIDELMSDITNGTVIDPFDGAGTIVLSALRYGNKAIYTNVNNSIAHYVTLFQLFCY